MTASPAREGSEPCRTPITFPDSFFCTAFENARDIVTPSGTGWKPRDSAEARSASRSFPPSAAIRFARSSVAHIFIATRGPPSAGSSKSSPFHDVWMTCQPYPAEGVVWMTIAPAAPTLAAMRYL